MTEFKETELDERAIKMAKVLSADAVERAGHGHPGSPVSLAPIAYTLYQHFIKHDPNDPNWEGRDRFILSGGHASLTQYVQLYFSGYGLTLDDLKNFRGGADTRTPGHPEYGLTPGIEMTTGPLGQGFASAIGFAYGQRFQRGLLDPEAPEGESPFDHNIWVICGEGDIEEGISGEAASLAANQQLGNLTVIFDANRIQIEGDTNLVLAEDVLKRFQAYGWYTDEFSFIQPDGSYKEDVEGLADTIAKADKLWEAAEQAATKANDPALLQRVRVGRLPVYYVMIVREAELKRVAGARKPTLAGMPLRQRFFEVAAAAKMTHIAEGRLMDDFRAAAVLPERHDAAPPPGCDGLAAGRWFDFQDDEFRLARPGEWVRLTPDPAASDGVAARMPGGHNEWAVALPLDAPALARSKGQRWRMAVAVRVEKTGQEGVAFTYGLYDGEAKKGLGGGAVKAADIKGDGYALYEVGTHQAGPQRYLWVAPAGNAANVPAVWVDRFVLVAPE